ncbi:E3 ubiquitin-protein ligase TRIM45-like [Saccostrea echinata]|uniref:E3 ubiquitin-protein ligase TRIM45-like n=1 Tax=Saccostrea echinata TaxID=191078 RepID=UPI002A804FF7|nr:E3 ubiquitin-protein ligase TRIM45-like [Saccostrea echinata]
MATPISWAQEVITCDLCDNPTKQFCNNCQVNLCEECINKHVKKQESLNHDIVPFKNRKIRLVFPKCEFHPHQRCEAHCQRCDIPVCIKCVITSHNGHNVKDIPRIFNNRKREIQKENHEIESSIIPKYKKQNEDAEKHITKSMEKIDEMEKEIEKHINVWHQENLIKKVQENKKMLKSNKVSEVTNYKSKVKEYRNIPADIYVSIPTLKTNTVQGKELSIELGECKATLSQTSLSNLTEEVSYLSMKEFVDKVRVIATIPTGAESPLVVCVGADKAWVTGKYNTLTCVDIHGSVHETITTTCLDSPNDISVTRQGELMYSDNKEN